MPACPSPRRPTRTLPPGTLAVLGLLGVGASSLPVGGLRGPADVLALAKVEAGLCVHIGCGDGTLTGRLTNGGRVLVHGLTRDELEARAARAYLRRQGLYGLASVERVRGLTPLPYADNLVNLVVADLDALGAAAPPAEEIRRVLAPGGVACLRKQGEWKRTVKPRPHEMDDWTHFDYGPEGNGVSHDRLVRPPTSVQWLCGVQDVELGGNPAAFHVHTGVRAAGGRVFFGWGRARGNRRDAWYNGRDGFNGVPLWSVATPNAFYREEHHLVAGADRVYTYLEKGGPLVALDAATGRVAQTYREGGTWNRGPHQAAVRLAGETLLQTDGRALYALDVRTGALRWKHVEDGGLVLFPSAAPRDGRVFFLRGTEVVRGSSRWPVGRAEAVVCLRLATGKELWRNREVEGAQVGQLVYDGGGLALFGSGAIGGGTRPYIGLVRAADGKLLWHTTFKTRYNRFGYNLVARDGALYYADAWRVYRLDRKDGAETTPYALASYNQRCNRLCATDGLFIFGLVTYVDPQFRGTIQSVARSGCAQGAVPANGLLYFTPNACHCIAELRGHVALSPEPVRAPLPDDQRLDRGGGGPDLPEARPGRTPAGPVAADWTRPAGAQETTPVTAGGRTYVAVIHEHRLECRGADGKVLWSFTAGGRITGPPVFAGGLCLFGAHDGRVYCLKAGDGTLVWRFLAAPYERRIVAYGQLESSWPVYGVVLHEGLLCCSAGLHPEVGGGLFVYGLEPATAALRWKRVLRKSPQVYAGGRKFVAAPNHVLNDVPQSDGKQLVLPGITFRPDESQAALQARLDGRQPRKKR